MDTRREEAGRRRSEVEGSRLRAEARSKLVARPPAAARTRARLAGVRMRAGLLEGIRLPAPKAVRPGSQHPPPAHTRAPPQPVARSDSLHPAASPTAARTRAQTPAPAARSGTRPPAAAEGRRAPEGVPEGAEEERRTVRRVPVRRAEGAAGETGKVRTSLRLPPACCEGGQAGALFEGA